MKSLTALILIASLSAPAFARKGDIEPVPGKGIEIAEVSGRKAACANIHGIRIRMHVTTGEGFLTLHVAATNNTDAPVKLEPLPFTLVSEGDAVEPLEAEQWAELKYPHVQLLPISKDGKIKDEGYKKEPLRVFTPGQSVPGQGTGGSLAEQMTSDSYNEASYNQRVEVTKEAYAMKASLIRRGGTLAPGKTESAQLVYQRNSVQIPMVARFEHAGVRANVKFIRAAR